MKSKILQTILNVYFGWLFLLFVLSFSFNFNLIPNVGGWCSVVFEYLASITQSAFTEEPYVNYQSGEDSLGLYFNVLNITVLSGLATFLVFKTMSIRKVLIWVDYFKVFVRYYVILMLLFYGFDKVYKMQFSLPEPNIEYTRVKDLHTDILFWTTMGKSYSYSLITGLMEVAAGIFLIFYKTRLLGVLLTLVAFTQVFLINIGFDVTMKVFSGMLLLMSIYLLLPYLKMLSKIFFTTVSTAIVIPSFQSSLQWFGYKKYLKWIVVVWILAEGNYKAFSTFNFNDDMIERPYANGAYQVDSYTINGVEDYSARWERFYIHREGYFIIDFQNEDKLDYKMEFISGSTQLKLTYYDGESSFIDFVKTDSLVRIVAPFGRDSIIIKAHQLSY